MLIIHYGGGGGREEGHISTRRSVSGEKQNRPFPSSGLSLSQNESSCETFHMKMSLICMKMNL